MVALPLHAVTHLSMCRCAGRASLMHDSVHGGCWTGQVVQCRGEWAGLTTCHVAYASAVLGFEPDYLLSKVDTGAFAASCCTM